MKILATDQNDKMFQDFQGKNMIEIKLSKEEDNLPTGNYHWIELKEIHDRENGFVLDVFKIFDNLYEY